MALQNIPTPVCDLANYLYWTPAADVWKMDISSGISSYFSNTEIETWGYMGCLEYLAKVCAHLTSGDHDEILDKYKNHLFSIISSTSSLKKAKDKALRLNDTAKRSFQRIEVTSFFKRLDMQVDANATDSLAYATKNLVNAKENLFESKLKACAYDRFVENTDVKNDRSSKRLRQETIIAEENKKLPDTNTVSKADGDNFDEQKDDDEDQDVERVEEESYSSNYVSSSPMGIFSESYSQQASSDSSSLLSILKKYCASESTSQYDPAHSFIVDLSLSSKIRGQFSNEEWAKLVKRRPDVVRKSCHHEIESLIAHLFSQKMDLLQARKQWYELRNCVAPKYNNEFSYSENDWEKIKRWVERVTGQFLDAFESLRNPLQNNCHEREWTGDYLIPLIQGVLKLDGNFYVPWGEISVLASLRRRNNDKDILIEQVDRSHQVDLLCNYEQYEIACALACGGPYSYDLTKLASDEFNLPRIMKDMLDDLELKLLKAGKNQLRPYIIGIQSYMTEIRVYLIEKHEIYFLHHLKSFNLPLTFSTYYYLKVALRVAWNIRGLVNSLVWELKETLIDDDNDGFKTPPTVLLNNMKTIETPPKQPKKKKI
ncbi:7964_t:CDS:10 [Cetraspora pellucida]|uniref:7964_t:CDS:1 n=1 Tax=Cetraspora pellucida TaxID=1433469 RepID=A0ACA9KA80_9GLOM|nr:7964_t:CDS:10 [Cetraspora pellucida]